MKIKTYNNQTTKVDLEYTGGNLVALPALIDPHVHFRVPGAEHKEDWITGSKAAIAGGVTTVFDMPNNQPSTIDEQKLHNKKRLIEEQLKESGIDLNYHLYFGASPDNLEEIRKVKDEIAGIKMFMGASTGSLLVDKREDQEKIFKLAGELGLVVAVHAENNTEMEKRAKEIGETTLVHDHSKIRDREAAIKSTKEAIEMAENYNTTLYILHGSTKEEVELVREAKDRKLPVYLEVTPHHLFLTEDDYDQLGTKVQMNPPMRELDDLDALWDGILDGVVDTIGTDHAPHTLEEKSKPYGQAPSGVPGIETYLPLLLDAHNKGRISLEKIVELTRTNIEHIFNIPSNNDWTIVDLNLVREVKNENLKTKCGWSPFAGRNLKGWPVATVLNSKIYKL